MLIQRISAHYICVDHVCGIAARQVEKILSRQLD